LQKKAAYVNKNNIIIETLSEITGMKLFIMAKKISECPLYNPLNCKEYNNPQLCAFVRPDRTCYKKKKTKTPKDQHNPAETVR
jgi:hypothetical protein